MSEKARLRARYTGNREICYRWVGEVGGGSLVHAQKHPEAELVGFDTWSDENIDERIQRKTVVALPVGLLVLDSTRNGGSHSYAAGILTAEPGGRVDYSRARHVRVLEADREKGLPRRHEIEVDNVRRVYAERV